MGVKAGEPGQTPAKGGCLPSREGVTKTTLAFVLGHAVDVGLQDLAYKMGRTTRGAQGRGRGRGIRNVRNFEILNCFSDSLIHLRPITVESV